MVNAPRLMLCGEMADRKDPEAHGEQEHDTENGSQLGSESIGGSFSTKLDDAMYEHL